MTGTAFVVFIHENKQTKKWGKNETSYFVVIDCVRFKR